MILGGLFGALSIAASGCSPPAVQRIVADKLDKSAISQADEIYAELVLGKDDALLARLPSELRTQQNVDMLSKIRELIPAEPGKPAVLVGYNITTHPAGDTLVISRRYDYPRASLLMQTRFVRQHGGPAWTSDGFYLGPATKEALSAMAFDAATTPPPQKQN